MRGRYLASPGTFGDGSAVNEFLMDSEGRLIVSGAGGGGGGASAEYNATLPTYTDGDDTALQTNQKGVLLVGVTDLTGAQGDLTDLGRQAANQSVPMALSTEDKAALDAIIGLASTIAAGQVTLSTSAASVRAANTSRKRLEVRNNDAAINVAVGNTGVTITTGFLLLPGQSIIIEKSSAQIFAVAASGTPVVSYLEQ